MQTAALLVILAAIGGFVVVRTIFRDVPAKPHPAASEAPEELDQATSSPSDEAAEDTTGSTEPSQPADLPAQGRRRRLLTAAALTDALALDGEEELRPSFFGRSLAFGRLLLVIVFICGLAGGTLFLLGMMVANKAGIHP
jgi:hypothetical protein